jgi:hypothetical protein
LPPQKPKEKEATSKPKKAKGIKGLKPKKSDAGGKGGKARGDGEGDVDFWNSERAKLGLKPLK